MARNANLIEIGMGRATLWGCWKTDHRLADDVDVRFLVARSGSVTAALGVADFSLLWPATCLRLRAKVAAALSIPAESVGIFTTQNHGADPESDRTLDHDKLDQAFVAAAQEAHRRLAPVEIARVAIRPPKPLAFCRRVAFQDLGKFTFWFGFRIDQQGRPDCSELLKKALTRLARGQAYQYRCPYAPGSTPGEEDSPPPATLPVPEPLLLQPASDELLQALFFRTPDGQPIGSLLRYPTHPAAANRRGADWHSGDFPAYLRRRIEQRFGGTSLFLTGPCGDQAPPVGEKSLAAAEAIGHQLADAAFAALKNATWRSGGTIAAISPEVELKIRPDMPASFEAAKQAIADYETQIKSAAATGRPLAEIKRLSDLWERQIYIGFNLLGTWCGLDFAGRAGQTLRWPIFLMRLGESIIAGLPGEPFGGYSRRMRDETLGDALIVAEEANGYLSYLPTSAEANLGGYGANASIVDAAAEDTLAAAIRSAVATLNAH
jgi:hypothetical protein